MWDTESLMGKIYAREASMRVKEKVEANRREQEQREREQQSLELEKHAPKPRKHKPVDANREAAVYGAEQHKINLERVAKRQKELLEVQRKFYEELSKEDAEAEERRLIEKEKNKQDLRRKAKEHKSWCEAKADHQLAAQRARKVQRDRPELIRRSSSVNTKGKKELKKCVNADHMPDTKKALQRIKKYRQEEKEKIQQNEQNKLELCRSRSEHRKELVKNHMRERAKSRPSNYGSCDRFVMLCMEERVKEMKKMIDSIMHSS
ncbi:Hypothetical predicted protein [Cloeon dipterum]|uniref:Uncharacterized protein n=1 Tax=Cloeon dipterum TaxID=197152 RepID=A0A8S1CEZ2_9INSE|nr:Hypothetical predicted protein [Cloeon dipterum]